jgi:hypothetical protein
MKKIKSIAELKKLANNKIIEVSILLNGGLKSTKSIMFWKKTGKFMIENYIDNSPQSLTEKQLSDKKYTNIGEAIKKGALILNN